MPEPSALIAAFLARRTALLHYFSKRVGEVEAEDLLQEVYVRIATLPDEDIRNPGGYLYRLGSNIMLDRLRQNQSRAARDHAWRETHHVVTDSGEDVSDTVPADEALIARDQVRHIERALGELPEAVQQSFRMHKLEGLSHAEVAERMGVSRSLIEKHMMRAMRHLVASVGR
ncbi:RNA polymerase sigma factor [Sphingomonas azotifigens]|uniref:RNA polymerase sigma factor n=1 Tax=Sphingomonas azotifigens TaxID=330920 RepID=UPI000A064AAB|nr:RNA polymerase sigma factor [Sphingomonas azotifigens]